MCIMQTTVMTIVSYGFLPEEYVHMFCGGYDYRSVEVNGTEYTVEVNGMEYTDVAVPLIYMAAGLQVQ